MPTLNPRINVTLSPSLDALVSRMAQLQRVSKASVIRELLEAAEPSLQRAAALMEAASAVSQGFRDKFAQSLDQATTDAETVLADQLATMETLTADLVAEAQSIRTRRPARSGLAPNPQAGVRGARRVEDPPSSKRGVKSSRRRVSGGQP